MPEPDQLGFRARLIGRRFVEIAKENAGVAFDLAHVVTLVRAQPGVPFVVVELDTGKSLDVQSADIDFERVRDAWFAWHLDGAADA
jgi:hypothetical protein